MKSTFSFDSVNWLIENIIKTGLFNYFFMKIKMERLRKTNKMENLETGMENFKIETIEEREYEESEEMEWEEIGEVICMVEEEGGLTRSLQTFRKNFIINKKAY
ncbi:CLUMA_CG011765, isoform A [Clunio marinus]|uniref:CLUMA_CG011765, isoform A n=1 Tax=Clunio marinus TaxID=568069 RepID=A0A1J1IDR9_9DIPT|nr:CLUMA_CG011765, isoform A [Clunio marinus]